MSYLLNALGKQASTPQSQPIPGSKQVKNNAGGYGWEVDDLVRLRRFICLGSEKGTYYVGEQTLTLENAETIARMVQNGRGLEVVKEILEYSLAGRTAKNDPILFALALCVRKGEPETKRAAYEAVSKICRIPTFLFSFVQFVENLETQGTGWGRGMRRAVSDWYLDKSPKDLAFTVTKYRQRNGWSHKDLLRLSHAKPQDDGHQVVFKYLTKGPEILETYEGEPKKVEEEFDLCDHPAPADQEVREAVELLKVVEEVSKMSSEGDLEWVCAMIRRHHLAREHLPTHTLNSTLVWGALLEQMPLTAMIRNLGKMTAIGLLGREADNEHSKRVVNKLKDQEALRKARIHPFNVLVALKVYSQGRGEKGKLTWDPVPAVKDALNSAFYLSFKFVEPTNQRVVIGLDVSGSMSCPVLGSDAISCREAAMAMSMVLARTEPFCKMMAFTGKLVPLNGVSPKNTLEQNLQATSNLPFGATDCSLPMIWARENNVKADTFVIYTDNDTWAGKVHPSQALAQYRSKMGVPHAKLIVVGMAASNFTIADPNDRGMLDVAGFDSGAPEVMRNFMLGLI